jgi:ornithine cyclodeaminase/alanine dehydrogenase-like protein (mu-crystallin family)
MILVLSEADVATALSMADGVRLVEQALQQHALGGGVVMPRISADLPGNAGAFRVMSAIVPSLGFFGLKTLTGYPGRRLPGETYFAVLLFSCDNGALRAVIAANRLTGIRTGAATGVAARYLARPDARVLGVIGAGVQARYQVAALREVRPLSEVRIFDIDAAKGESFAREIEGELQVAARPVASARDAVAGCDLVVTITTAKAPVFDGHWIDDGAHVTGAGSNTPAKRELDDTVFRRGKLVVDFRDQALQEAGDLQQALRTGVIAEDAIHAELGEIITGSKAGRTSDREITLFKSVGMAIEDLATASFAYQQALAMGLGTYVPLEGPAASGDERVPQLSGSGRP